MKPGGPLQTGGLVQMSASRQRNRRRPQNMIRAAIRQCERSDQWADMTRMTPVLADLGRNMARYLTELVPAVNAQQPLLVRCLDNGMRAWQTAGEVTAQARFLAFVRGLLYPLPEALEWAVTRPEGAQTSVWNPIDQCLHDWWRGKGLYPEARLRSRPHDTAYVDISPADFRLIVLVRFLARDPIALTPLSGRLDELVSRYG